ncbi:MAG: hypothetical protein OXI87_07565 [Albidovulum sp.]|nr:hypothetical protein [Albidovulum sp.]
MRHHGILAPVIGRRRKSLNLRLVAEQWDRNGIGVSVAVTAMLQPAPELALAHEERPVALRVRDSR